MGNVENIIFDLGNVLIDLDLQATQQHIAQLSELSLVDVESRIASSEVFVRYEKGLIPSSEFRQQVNTLFDAKWDDQLVDALWNEILLDIPPERTQLLERLKPDYRLFVLSNTNDIHIQKFEQIMEAGYGWSAFQELFERIYYSHLMGKRKPEPEIFTQVLIENQLLAQHTLFIDDNHDNVISAKQLGLQTFHLTDPTRLVDFFDGVQE